MSSREIPAPYAPAIARTRAALAAQGVTQALLSSSETLAQLTGFVVPWEDWPVADPFTAGPTLLYLSSEEARLIVPTLYLEHADAERWDVTETRCHRFIGTPPDPFAELAAVLDALPWRDGPVGVETKTLTAHVVEVLRSRGLQLASVAPVLHRARAVKTAHEIGAVRSACRIADLIQQTVKDQAQPGQTETELASIAPSAVAADLQQRTPALITIDSGAASGDRSSIVGDRRLGAGDIVLTDTSPWIDGAWSDTANAIVLGEPTSEHRRMFDALRRSLELAIGLCRPGAVAGEIDRRVRVSLNDWGDHVYRHHTGHGLGATWNELPQIIPASTDVVEEGMVIAVEPALYVPGWGGMRLEHVLVVGPNDNELLSRFEHTL